MTCMAWFHQGHDVAQLLMAEGHTNAILRKLAQIYEDVGAPWHVSLCSVLMG